MALVEAKCSACGAILNLGPNTAFCEFCGMRFIREAPPVSNEQLDEERQRLAMLVAETTALATAVTAQPAATVAAQPATAKYTGAVDLKQAAQQAVAAQQSAAEQKQTLRRKKEKYGVDDLNPQRLALTEEQAQLVAAFIAAVPARCWEHWETTDYRTTTYVKVLYGYDGTIRMSERIAYVDSLYKYLKEFDEEYARYKDRQKYRKAKKISDKLERENLSGQQQHIQTKAKTHENVSFNLLIFKDGDCFAPYWGYCSEGHIEYFYKTVPEKMDFREILLEELTQLLKSA